MLSINPLNVNSRSAVQPLSTAAVTSMKSNPFAAQRNEDQMGLGPNVQDMNVTNFGKKGIANTIAIA